VSQKSIFIFALIFALACMALFALAPELDLSAAHVFFREGRFIGSSPAGDILRRLFWDAPYVALAGALAAYALRRMGRIARGPDGRAVVFLLATLALGPGLLINGLLKEHTGRPRPVFTEEFGGAWAFRPWYDPRGACAANCSFASGETATSAWTLAPALLTPPPARPYALAAAFLLTLATALLRMAFGGHYLSDVALAAVFTVLIVLAGYRWYARGESRWI
jgi:membrane-associated phospholipid phosphatase